MTVVTGQPQRQLLFLTVSESLATPGSALLVDYRAIAALDASGCNLHEKKEAWECANHCEFRKF